MSGRVVAELDGWQQGKATGCGADGDLVFAEPLTGDVLRRGALMRRYRQALKAAQLEPTFRFHDLRHSFGTATAAAGVPMRTLMAMMGHEDIHTTLIYADYAPTHRRSRWSTGRLAPETLWRVETESARRERRQSGEP